MLATRFTPARSTSYRCTGGVEMRVPGQAAVIFGNLSEVSFDGGYVETAATLPAGQELAFVLRAGKNMIRGRARTKTSTHRVGMGLEFLHLSDEDQEHLDSFIGSLAGDQKTLPEEALPRPVASSATLRARAPQNPSDIRLALAERITSSVNQLNGLEQDLVKGGVDPRLLAQFHDAIGHVRQTAWTLDQWIDLEIKGGDPFDVLPQLEAERMQMLGKLAHNVIADLDSSSINQFTLGVSELYASVEHLYRRLRILLVDDAAE